MIQQLLAIRDAIGSHPVVGFLFLFWLVWIWWVPYVASCVLRDWLAGRKVAYEHNRTEGRFGVKAVVIQGVLYYVVLYVLGRLTFG